jgi:glucose dehydrogenase
MYSKDDRLWLNRFALLAVLAALTMLALLIVALMWTVNSVGVEFYENGSTRLIASFCVGLVCSKG